MSVAASAKIFFATNLLSANSCLIAARIAARIGLINTMVFTDLPASHCLMIVPFVDDLDLAIALLLVRSLLSQMDVLTRTSYVMVAAERPAAASVTAVPRSLGSHSGQRSADCCWPPDRSPGRCSSAALSMRSMI